MIDNEDKGAQAEFPFISAPQKRMIRARSGAALGLKMATFR